MTKYQAYFDAKFAEKMKNMATKECIKSLREKILKQT